MIPCISRTFLSVQKRFPATPYVYALVANICIATMQCATKLLGPTIPINYLLYLRGITLLVIHTFVFIAAGGDIYVKKRQALWLLLFRVILSAFGLMFNFYAIKYVSLSIINSIWMTGPIWTNFIEAIVMKTKIQAENITMAVICLFGLLLITKPTFLFSQESDPNLLFYSLLTLVGTMFISLSLVISRKLNTYITNLQNLQYFYYGQGMMNIVIAVFQGQKGTHIENFSVKSLLCVILLVCAAYIAQWCNVRSLTLKSASEVGLFTYSLIVTALAYDFFLFDEKMDWLTILGVVIICSSLLMVFARH